MKDKHADVITLNVGGVRHQTLRSTLEKIPNTKLANIDDIDCDEYSAEKNEYFFDRNATVFEYILNYYRGGKLHIGRNLCSDMVRKELDYWGIDEYSLDSCCWVSYKSQANAQKSMERFERARTHAHLMAQEHLRPHRTRWKRIKSWGWAIMDIPASCKAAKIVSKWCIKSWGWAIMDIPASCKAAKVYALISLVVTLLAICTLCVETMPEYRQELTIEQWADYYDVDVERLLQQWSIAYPDDYPDFTLDDDVPGNDVIDDVTDTAPEETTHLTFTPNSNAGENSTDITQGNASLPEATETSTVPTENTTDSSVQRRRRDLRATQIFPSISNHDSLIENRVFLDSEEDNESPESSVTGSHADSSEMAISIQRYTTNVTGCIECDTVSDSTNKKDSGYLVTLISTTSFHISDSEQGPVTFHKSVTPNIKSIKFDRAEARQYHTQSSNQNLPEDSTLSFAKLLESTLPVTTAKQAGLFGVEDLAQLSRVRIRRDAVNITAIDNRANDTPIYERDDSFTSPNEYLATIDFFCYTFFTLELLLRFIFAPSKMEFMKSFLNIVDVICVLLFFVETGVNSLTSSEQYRVSILDALFILRMLRIFRVFRLAQHHKGLRVLMHTVGASMNEILMLALFLMIGTVMFAALIYYADGGNPSFENIPKSFWWVIVTMTTLGYGDMVPESLSGKLVGAVCAVCGVLLIAFTVPVIVNNFMRLYEQVPHGKDFTRMEKLQSNLMVATAAAKLKQKLHNYSKQSALGKMGGRIKSSRALSHAAQDGHPGETLDSLSKLNKLLKSERSRSIAEPGNNGVNHAGIRYEKRRNTIEGDARVAAYTEVNMTAVDSTHSLGGDMSREADPISADKRQGTVDTVIASETDLSVTDVTVNTDMTIDVDVKEKVQQNAKMIDVQLLALDNPSFKTDPHVVTTRI